MKKIQPKAYLFLFSQNISLFGSLVTSFAITWSISLQTNSSVLLSLAMVCVLLPQMITMLIGGRLADHWSRKWLIIGSDGAIAGLTAVLIVLQVNQLLSIPVLLLFTTCRALGQGLQGPAVSATYPDLVAADQLHRINGLNQTCVALTTLLAPVLGGIVLAQASLVIAFVLDIVTAIIEISCLLPMTLPRQVTTSEKPTPIWRSWRLLRRQTPLWSLLLLYGFGFLLITPLSTLGTLLVQRHFGAQVARLTLYEVIWSVGAVSGGLLLARLKHLKQPQKLLWWSLGSFGVFMALMGYLSYWPLFLGITLGAGFCLSLVQAAQTTLIQQYSRPEQIGQVFGVFQMVASGMTLIGALSFGPIANVSGLGPLTIFCGVLCLLSASIVARHG